MQGSAVGALPSLHAMADSSVRTKLLAGAGMVCVSTTAPGLRIGREREGEREIGLRALFGFGASIGRDISTKQLKQRLAPSKAPELHIESCKERSAGCQTRDTW